MWAWAWADPRDGVALARRAESTAHLPGDPRLNSSSSNSHSRLNRNNLNIRHRNRNSSSNLRHPRLWGLEWDRACVRACHLLARRSGGRCGVEPVWASVVLASASGWAWRVVSLVLVAPRTPRLRSGTRLPRTTFLRRRRARLCTDRRRRLIMAREGD